MQRYFQWFINGLVLVMAGLMVYAVLPSYFVEYSDETIPDEVLALDEEIYDALYYQDDNFGELYAQRSVSGPYELTYLSGTRPILAHEDNYAESVKSIVYITTEDTEGYVYYGSGTILTADGLILTNYHVVDGTVKVIVTTHDGEHYAVTGVVASDELLDVTFLQIEAEGLHPIMIGDSDELRVGQETLVIGHAEGFINTLSVGNIAGFRNYDSQGMGMNIQITNPISMGNSGGALLNAYGEIIGIPTWSVEYDQNSVQVQNLNFAVPINAALALLK